MMNTEEAKGFGLYRASSGQEVALAMQELWLSGTVLPTGARLVVRHIFQSQETEPLEVVYSFMLPRDAALRSFRIVGEDFEIESDLRPTKEAVKLYERGIEKGHLSTLAQTYADGIVNLNVGNIRPGEKVSVYLEIVAGVDIQDDGFRFRFPFTLAPGYHSRARSAEVEPGVGEIDLPDDEFGDVILPRWHANAKELHRVGFNLNLQLVDESVEVSSPSHSIGVRHTPKSDYQVRLATEGEQPNRDLVLDARYSTKKPIVLAGTDANGKARFAVVVPSSCLGEARAHPRRFVFLVDRSGSMSSEPMEQAKRAVRACLGALREQDQFGIVVFDDRSEHFESSLKCASLEQREAADQFLHRIDSRGGTKMAAGIEAAVTLLGSEGGDILLLTDGQVFGGEAIMERVRQSKVRVHCLGIGSASQDRFLSLLARQTGGVCHFATLQERVDMAALAVFAAIGTPVAINPQCKISNSDEMTIEPPLPEVVFSGSPLVIMGSCDKNNGKKLTISWKDASQPLSIELTSSVATLGETLRLVQGARLITDVDSQYLACNEIDGAVQKRTQGRIERKLHALSKEYCLASRTMALVAVVKRKSDKQGKVPKMRVIPLGIPEGVKMNSYFEDKCCYSMSPPESSEHMRHVCYREELPPEKNSSPRMRRTESMEWSSERQVRQDPFDVDLGQDNIDALPTWLRNRRSESLSSRRESSVQASSEDVWEDILLSIASQISPDGGLPGRDQDTRIALTLLAFLAFYELERTASAPSPFVVHMQKLKEFLLHADRSGLEPHHERILEQTLAKVNAGEPVFGPWKETVFHVRSLPDTLDVWEILARNLQDV
jgi:Ca-activated chloride channel family protein